ncbi:MAG: 50S ribosomal protein L10 [Planctomycetota bacterium]|jgi:large subunit ribosomal protein L10
MPSAVKQLLTAQLTEELKGLQDLILADASRLSAEKAHVLRGRLMQVGVRMRVVKNRLVTRAFREAGVEAFSGPLQGATAVLFGGDGAPQIARLLKDWNKKETAVQVKGGLLEGRAGSREEAEAWAELPNRAELLSMILGGIVGPASGLAGAFEATLAQFVGCVAAHVEKKEKE